MYPTCAHFFTEVDSCHIVSNSVKHIYIVIADDPSGKDFFHGLSYYFHRRQIGYLLHPFAFLAWHDMIRIYIIYIYIQYIYIYTVYIYIYDCYTSVIIITIHFSFDSQKFYLLSSRVFGWRPTFRNGEVNPNGETYPVPWIC